MPCLGGEAPSESESAAARAETPGPAAAVPPPARGLKLSTPCHGFLGVDVCSSAGGGVPKGWVGIGEANRAVASARGTEVPYDRPRADDGDDDSWAADEDAGPGESPAWVLHGLLGRSSAAALFSCLSLARAVTR